MANPLTKREYEVCGLRFRLKPTTRKTFREVSEYIEAPPIDRDDVERAWDLFVMMTEPVGKHTHDDVDLDEFDAKIIDVVLMDFFPTVSTITGVLSAFLRS